MASRGPAADAATDPGVLQDEGAALSVSLEMLADLGVVELGADEPGAARTVAP